MKKRNKKSLSFFTPKYFPVKNRNLFYEGGYNQYQNGYTISYNPGATNYSTDYGSSLNNAYNVGNYAYEAIKNTENAFNLGNAVNGAANVANAATTGSTGLSLGLNTASPVAESAAIAAGSGASAFSTASGVAGTVLGTGMLAYDTIQAAKLNDTEEYEKMLDSIGDTSFQFNNVNDILNTVRNSPTIENVNWEDVRGEKMRVGKAALDGATAGSGIGTLASPGWGTLLGAGIGALVGVGDALITNATMEKKAKRKANELNAMAEEELEDLRENINLGVTNYSVDLARNALKRYVAYGGPLFNEFSNGITIINEGGTHENNPFGGVQVGVDSKGIPNLVEEGEVIFNDYVFSDRLKIPETVRKQYKLRGNKKTTFADSAKEITKMSEEMPNDPIVKRTMELRLNQLMNEQEIVRKTKQNKKNSHSNGGEVNTYKNGEKIKQWYNSNLKGNWGEIGTGLMQAAPVFGSLAATINDLTGGNEADYTNVDKYEAAINNAYNPIEAKTLSDYLEYNPYNISFGLNKLAASQAASRNALRQTTNNPAALRAAILASDYNYGNQIGEELRRAQEYNDANRRLVADFNRGTNQFNAQATNAANQFNAQQAANKAVALGQAAQWREQINQANRSEKSANLTGLYEGIAGLGETFMNLKDRRYLRDNGIIGGPNGTLVQVPNKNTSNTVTIITSNVPTNEDIMKWAEEGVHIVAKGGKIKRTKNKRRLS